MNMRYKIERSKGVNGGNSRVEKIEDVWSEVRELPQNQSNFLVCPSLCKDSCVGTRLANKGTQAPSKEPTLKDMMNMVVSLTKRMDVMMGNGMVVPTQA